VSIFATKVFSKIACFENVAHILIETVMLRLSRNNLLPLPVALSIFTLNFSHPTCRYPQCLYKEMPKIMQRVCVHSTTKTSS